MRLRIQLTSMWWWWVFIYNVRFERLLFSWSQFMVKPWFRNILYDPYSMIFCANLGISSLKYLKPKCIWIQWGFVSIHASFMFLKISKLCNVFVGNTKINYQFIKSILLYMIFPEFIFDWLQDNEASSSDEESKYCQLVGLAPEKPKKSDPTVRQRRINAKYKAKREWNTFLELCCCKVS